MTITARGLRLDRDRWRWLADGASPTGAVLMVLGAYLLLAWDRFGWLDFALRPTVRLMLIGFYGWIWLAVASWVIARFAFASSGSLSSFLRLTGHAHLPLLLLAALIALLAVTLNVTNIARWPALFAVLFWMPAMLVQAVLSCSTLNRRQAAIAVTVPYLVWAAVVGHNLWSQVGHLL